MATAQTVPVIEAVNLQKIYATGDTPVVALADVHLRVERGEFVAIVGASGSGKSTLMNLIGLLDRPTGGVLRLDGVDVAQLTPNQRAMVRNRKVGFVFQGFNLLRRTSALENVELPLLYAGVSAHVRAQAAKAALTQVGLGERMDHMPNQLSGGQQQRVAIARALVNQPALLLADEPTGNLDSTTTREILKLFVDLNVQHGITVVMVTHESDVAAVSRRVVQFKDGRIVLDGPPPAEWTPAVPAPWHAQIAVSAGVAGAA
jgi:putative ABC transport system ATP-binding protein